MTDKGRAPNKWLVLIMSTLIHAAASGIPFMAMSVLFTSVTKDIDLNSAQIGILWGATPLGVTLFSVVGGLLGDRFGFYKVIGIGCLALALTNACRGISNDFVTLAISMLLFGLSVGIVLPNLPKVVGFFFPSRQLGLALGIVIAGFQIGGMLGTALSATVMLPLVGSWRNVLFCYSAICVIIGIIWLLVMRETKPSLTAVDTDITTTKVPFRKSLGIVLRVKDMWLLMISNLGLVGSFFAIVGYLPVYLENIATPKTISDPMASTIFIAGILGALMVPAISDRVGARKILIIVCVGVTGICTYLLSISDVAFFWLLVPLIGYSVQGAGALCFALPLEMKEIGPIYGGCATGLLATSHSVGSSLLPVIGGNLAELNQSWPFVSWAIFVFLGLPCLFWVRETIRK